jgi:hypothetical protein
MSHFAELDENNTVIRVLVGDNEMPSEGYDWMVETYGGRWVKTSYNNSFRKRYAGVGYSYNEDLDVFLLPKPYESWVLDEETYDWVPPIPFPEDDKYYGWDEESASWKELDGIAITSL